jgi:hypothetical protein
MFNSPKLLAYAVAAAVLAVAAGVEVMAALTLGPDGESSQGAKRERDGEANSLKSYGRRVKDLAPSAKNEVQFSGSSDGSITVSSDALAVPIVPIMLTSNMLVSAKSVATCSNC